MPEMTIQDWMNRGSKPKVPARNVKVTLGGKMEMPEFDERRTDAEVAAAWAAQALTEGRYELGKALATLAALAARQEATPKPIMQAAAAVPVAAAMAAQNELFAPSSDTPTEVAKSARCAFTLDGETCHGVIWWREGNTGDAEHPAVIAGWTHLDPSIDAYHRAEPPRG